MCNPVTTKKCSKCGETKTLGEFYAHRGGTLPHCKACHKQKCKDYYESHKGQFIARSRAWRKRNPERAKVHYQDARKKRRAAIQENQRRWRHENKERCREVERLYHRQLRAIALGKSLGKAFKLVRSGSTYRPSFGAMPLRRSECILCEFVPHATENRWLVRVWPVVPPQHKAEAGRIARRQTSTAGVEATP